MAFEKRRYYTYGKADYNKPVAHYADMEHVAGALYRGIPYNDEYGISYTDFFFWYEQHGIGWKDGNRRTDWAEEDMPGMIERASIFDTPEKFIAELDRRAAGEQCAANWIGAREVEIARIIAPENVSIYLEARERHRVEQEAKEREREAARAEKDAAFVAEQNAKSDEQIKKAVDVFENGGEFRNVEIDICRDRYDTSTYTLVNHLANIYNVNIPIKLKGWIANNLYSVIVEPDGRIERIRLNDGKRKSTTIFEYLNKLAAAITCGDMVKKILEEATA